MKKDASSNRGLVFRINRPIRVIAFITLWAFVCTSIDNIYFLEKACASPSTPSPVFIELPSYLGTIRYSWSPKPSTVNSKPLTIVHIQDAHCNYYAQKKIAEIIGYLRDEYNISVVNLEGGARDYDLSPFTDIQDKELRQKAADHFVKEGLVNGAEYFAINNPKEINLWGVEDVGLYIENLKSYRSSLAQKSDVDRLLALISRKISGRKLAVFSKDLLEFDIKYSQYRAGNMDFKEYAAYLASAAKTSGIDMGALTVLSAVSTTIAAEGGIDFKSANIQRDQLINALQKKLSMLELSELVTKTVEFKSDKISQIEFYGYIAAKSRSVDIDLASFPELRKYIAYISVYESTDRLALMGEMENAENGIRNTLCKNEEERRLCELSKNLAILKNLFNITLTSDDYNYYKQNESAFVAANFAQFTDVDISSLDARRKDMEYFYELSAKRDNAFLKNLVIARSPAEGWTTKQSQSGVTILVTGGFHTDRLTRLFKQHNIAYVSIMPNFKSCDGYECPYFRILSGNDAVRIKDALPSFLANSLATVSQLCPAMDQAVYSAFAPDTETVSKTGLPVGQAAPAAVASTKPESDKSFDEQKMALTDDLQAKAKELFANRDLRNKAAQMIKTRDGYDIEVLDLGHPEVQKLLEGVEIVKPDYTIPTRHTTKELLGQAKEYFGSGSVHLTRHTIGISEDGLIFFGKQIIGASEEAFTGGIFLIDYCRYSHLRVKIGSHPDWRVRDNTVYLFANIERSPEVRSMEKTRQAYLEYGISADHFDTDPSNFMIKVTTNEETYLKGINIIYMDFEMKTSRPAPPAEAPRTAARESVAGKVLKTTLSVLLGVSVMASSAAFKRPEIAQSYSPGEILRLALFETARSHELTIMTGIAFLLVIFLLYHYQATIDLFKRHLLDRLRIEARSKRLRDKMAAQRRIDAILAKKDMPVAISGADIDMVMLFLKNNNPLGSVTSDSIEKGDKIVVFQVPGNASGDGLGLKELNEIAGYELNSELMGYRRRILKSMVESRGIGRFLYSNYKEEVFIIRGAVNLTEIEKLRNDAVNMVTRRIRQDRDFRKAFAEIGRRDLFRSGKALYKINFGIAEVEGPEDPDKLTADINAHQAIIIESILRSAGVRAPPPVFNMASYKKAIEEIKKMREFLRDRGVFENIEKNGGYYQLKPELAGILRKRTTWHDMHHKDRILFHDEATYDAALNYFTAMGLQDYIKKWQINDSEALKTKIGIERTILGLQNIRSGVTADMAVQVDGNIRDLLDKAERYIDADPRIPAAQSVFAFHARAPPLIQPVYISLDVKKMGLANIASFEREIQDIEKLLEGPRPEMKAIRHIWETAADNVTRIFARNVEEAHRILDKSVNVRSYVTLVGGDEITLAVDVFDINAVTPEMLHEIRHTTGMRVAATKAVRKFRGHFFRRLAKDKMEELAHVKAIFALDNGIAHAKKLEAKGIDNAVVIQNEHGHWHNYIEPEKESPSTTEVPAVSAPLLDRKTMAGGFSQAGFLSALAGSAALALALGNILSSVWYLQPARAFLYAAFMSATALVAGYAVWRGAVALRGSGMKAFGNWAPIALTAGLIFAAVFNAAFENRHPEPAHEDGIITNKDGADTSGLLSHETIVFLRNDLGVPYPNDDYTNVVNDLSRTILGESNVELIGAEKKEADAQAKLDAAKTDDEKSAAAEELKSAREQFNVLVYAIVAEVLSRVTSNLPEVGGGGSIERVLNRAGGNGLPSYSCRITGNGNIYHLEEYIDANLKKGSMNDSDVKAIFARLARIKTLVDELLTHKNDHPVFKELLDMGILWHYNPKALGNEKPLWLKAALGQKEKRFIEIRIEDCPGHIFVIPTNSYYRSHGIPIPIQQPEPVKPPAGSASTAVPIAVMAAAMVVGASKRPDDNDIAGIPGMQSTPGQSAPDEAEVKIKQEKESEIMGRLIKDNDDIVAVIGYSLSRGSFGVRFREGQVFEGLTTMDQIAQIIADYRKSHPLANAPATSSTIQSIIPLFGFDKTKELGGETRSVAGVNVKRIELPPYGCVDPRPRQGGPDLLKYILIDPAIHDLKKLDLVYAEDGRLLAAFPVMPDGADTELTESFRTKARYLDISYYYFNIPRIGSTGLAMQWRAFAIRARQDQETIARYKKTSGNLASPLMDTGKSPYVYAQIDKNTGEWKAANVLSISALRPLELDNTCVEYDMVQDTGKYQIVIPILPTVYPPNIFQDTDRSYYRAIWKEAGLMPSHSILFVGPGAGLEVWVASLKGVKYACALGINPIEIENTLLTAKIAGCRIMPIVRDNLTSASGELHPELRGKTFDRVFWDMPEYTNMEIGAESSRLEDLWDSYSGTELFGRLTNGLKRSLAQNGMAVLWNVYSKDGIYREATRQITGILNDAGFEVKCMAGPQDTGIYFVFRPDEKKPVDMPSVTRAGEDNRSFMPPEGIYTANDLLDDNKITLDWLALQMARLNYEAFHEVETPPEDGELLGSRKAFEYMLTDVNEPARFNIEIRDGRVVGFVRYQLRQAGKSASIGNAIVAAEARNRGIGHDLIDSAINIIVGNKFEDTFEFEALPCMKRFVLDGYLPDRSQTAHNGLGWWLESRQRQVPDTDYGSGEPAKDRVSVNVTFYRRTAGPLASRNASTIASFAAARERNIQTVGVLIPVMLQKDTDNQEFNKLKTLINNRIANNGLALRVNYFAVVPGNNDASRAATKINYEKARSRIISTLPKDSIVFSYVPAIIRDAADSFNDYNEKVITDGMLDGAAPDIMVRVAVSHHLAYYLRHPRNSEVHVYVEGQLQKLLGAAGEGEIKDILKRIFEKDFRLMIKPFGFERFEQYRRNEEVVAQAA